MCVNIIYFCRNRWLFIVWKGRRLLLLGVFRVCYLAIFEHLIVLAQKVAILAYW